MKTKHRWYTRIGIYRWYRLVYLRDQREQRDHPEEWREKDAW